MSSDCSRRTLLTITIIRTEILKNIAYKHRGRKPAGHKYYNVPVVRFPVFETKKTTKNKNNNNTNIHGCGIYNGGLC